MYIGGVFFFVAGAALGAACGYAVAPLARVLREWRHYREVRLVSCPETLEPAAVAVDVRSAVLAALRGATDVHLCACSRWPEREGCDQRCLVQLAGDPAASKVSSIVRDWYADKTCAYCGKPIHADDRIDNLLHHRPALLDASQVSKPWDEVAPESLPQRFMRSHAVCWSCHEAEAFRREFPDLVVDRPFH